LRRAFVGGCPLRVELNVQVDFLLVVDERAPRDRCPGTGIDERGSASAFCGGVRQVPAVRETKPLESERCQWAGAGRESGPPRCSRRERIERAVVVCQARQPFHLSIELAQAAQRPPRVEGFSAADQDRILLRDRFPQPESPPASGLLPASGLSQVQRSCSPSPSQNCTWSPGQTGPEWSWSSSPQAVVPSPAAITTTSALNVSELTVGDNTKVCRRARPR
jgi:hypothetical protein